MMNVEDDYGESDEQLGFSDDGDGDEQALIDCILILYFL